MSRALVPVVIVALSLAWGCTPEAPTRRYELTGQILAVLPDRHELTVRHDDIVGFMPAMTMTFPVEPAALLEGRKPGELISGTLEVQDAHARLVSVTSRGEAPLSVNANQLALASGLLTEGDLVPDAAFIDQTDKRRSFAEWRGTVTLVTFIYTRCPLPTYCLRMDQNFATIQNAILEQPALAGHVKLISISMDPEHDTPAVLQAYAATRRANPDVWTFLTGDKVTIERFAGKLGVGIIRAENATEISHNLRSSLLGRDGRLQKVYAGNDWTPHEVLADLRAAVSAP
jgi:protein SCO1/2